MPYCPKCDMEFIDGITVCSDCGGLLAESEEVARTMQKEEALKKWEALQVQADLPTQTDLSEIDDTCRLVDTEIPPTPYQQAEKMGRSSAAAGVYVKKSQKYEDLKSSASAFLLVGGLLLIFSLLLWTGIVRLPMAGLSKMIFQTTLTGMGILALIVATRTTHSAKALLPQIAEEETATKQLMEWFMGTYDAAALDSSIEDADLLSSEELSLKRFQIIQDHLITEQDLPNQAYVDALSEELYSRIFEP
ncbi:MAG: hypothetical protein RR685_07880 [Hungatella sp.]